MITRRELMIVAGGTTLLTAGRIYAAETEAFGGPELERSIAAIEAESGGRLGVAVLDRGSGRRFAYRGSERFPMCSTFKFLLAAAILAEVEKGRGRLDRKVPVTAADILAHSPVTKNFVGREATVAELCEATMTVSDNGAANLLLPAIGGPQGLTAFARAIGDDITRLDRNEPSLNEAKPGDPRDTTSPNAMLADLDRLMLRSALKPGSRELLTEWLVANKTGDKRLRAGLPKDWRVGDKTGTGSRGTANDIAVFWPPASAPLVVASYLTGCPYDRDRQDAVHAAVARAIAAATGV